MAMKKLDEIEATNNVLVTGASRTDVELLIRAVRQLGAWRQLEVEDNPDVVNINPVLVDPDVLDLIEEANE